LALSIRSENFEKSASFWITQNKRTLKQIIIKAETTEIISIVISRVEYVEQADFAEGFVEIAVWLDILQKQYSTLV